jgi:hypothetical protein
MLRCAVCRTRRTTFAAMVEHERATGHKRPCDCGGYPYPHREGSQLCAAHPYVTLNRARHAQASAEDLMEAMISDILFGDHKPSKDQTCPF